MSMKTEGAFQFGEFQIDARARTLRREEEIVTLNFRAFDVLLYLVQNPGKVLTRNELLENVWQDAHVDENNLAQCISALRRALEEKPGNSYIVTLPGKGYQFVAPVRVVAQENLANVPDAASASNPGPNGMIFQQQTIRTSVVTEEKQQLSLPTPQRWGVERMVAALTIAVIAVAGIYTWKQFRRSPSSANPAAIGAIGTTTPRRSIAVLGFRNLSGRPEEGWISTALAEMLSTELEAGEKLRLVSGEDIARAKLDLPLADADSLSRDTLARLHKDLDSDLIVLGSYTALGEKPGTRIRLDLRLQDTVAGETIADVAVVGGESDLFDLVSQAGSRLREKLGVEAVSPVEAVSIRASSPSNRDAARLYSEGLARLRVFDALEARDLLQRAIAADPKYSLAHSALAEAWSRLGYDKKARQESQQAYDLSTNLSREGTLVVEGRFREIDHQWEKAIEVYRALFTLFPDNVDYGLKLADVQARGNKGSDSVATVESLRKLSPPASGDPRIEIAEARAWTVAGQGDFAKRQEQPLERAVEKARAQGSRAILADARQLQCRMFSAFQQEQNAVSACREAMDIFAASGDREHEGRALLTWGVVIAQTDAPEARRLIRAAQSIFRRNGSEVGLAHAFDNLAIVTDDSAAAEKMERESVAIWRRIDDTRNLTLAISNLAGYRTNQGDLRGALQLYEESLKVGRDNEDYGYAALANLNIAGIHQLQGDLAGAKREFEQVLALWQKHGDRWGPPYAMLGLGSVLIEEADFSSARKMYEQALAMRIPRGDKIPIAEAQLALADLSLEEGRSPAEQETAVRQTLEVFQKQKVHEDETQAWCVLARALLAEGKAAAAKEAMQHARSLSAKSPDPNTRWTATITAARIETAEKNPAQSAAGIAARKELATVITKSRELGYMGVELDARLALAEIEMKSGQVTAGREHLTAIEADAKAKGYNLIARKAAIARG